MFQRVFWLLCFKSTQKHSTWNTNWIRSEQNWCRGHSGICWRCKLERRNGILQTLFGRFWNGDWKTQSSTLPCPPSTFLFSTINWDMSSKNWKVLQKVTLHLESFGIPFEDGTVDNFMLTRTIRFWRGWNLCAHQTTLPIWNRKYRKWIMLNFVQERANTKWKFYKLTNLTVFAALLKDVPMGCKDSVLPEPLLENQILNCLTSENVQESLPMTIFACSEQLLCI